MNDKKLTPMDKTLDASFPASDPPSWTAGTQKERDARKGNKAGTVTKQSLKDTKAHQRIKIGATDIS